MNASTLRNFSRLWRLVLPGLWVGLASLAFAQEPRSWPAYGLGSPALGLAKPSGADELNSLLPEPNGSFVAVWDTTNSAIVQRRDASGGIYWSWTPPTPLPLTIELTRAVLSSRNRILWCSSARWFFLDRQWGTVVRAGSWNLPYLDPSRLVIQNENLHVLYEGSSLVYLTNLGLVKVTYASIYNTNMDFQTVLSTFLPTGYWHSFGGAWLLDYSQRTNQLIRLATLGPNLSVGTPFNIPLPAGAAGGFVDHRVLGADTDSIAVLSSVHWPHLLQTVHYVTHVDRAGNVLARHYLAANEIITGVATLNDGWALSGQFFSETEPRHLLFKLDAYGRPAWQGVVDMGGPFMYRMLNVVPPRALKLLDATNTVVLPLETRTWDETAADRRWEPPVEWAANPPALPNGGTNYFWITPLRVNQ